jgi:hypothetical protein
MCRRTRVQPALVFEFAQEFVDSLFGWCLARHLHEIQQLFDANKYSERRKDSQKFSQISYSGNVLVAVHFFGDDIEFSLFENVRTLQHRNDMFGFAEVGHMQNGRECAQHFHVF